MLSSFAKGKEPLGREIFSLKMRVQMRPRAREIIIGRQSFTCGLAAFASFMHMRPFGISACFILLWRILSLIFINQVGGKFATLKP